MIVSDLLCLITLMSRIQDIFHAHHIPVEGSTGEVDLISSFLSNNSAKPKIYIMIPK